MKLLDKISGIFHRTPQDLYNAPDITYDVFSPDDNNVEDLYGPPEYFEEQDNDNTRPGRKDDKS